MALFKMYAEISQSLATALPHLFLINFIKFKNIYKQKVECIIYLRIC